MPQSQVKSRWNPYPWERWFGRRRTVLLRHRDYACQTHGMAAQVRNKAAQLGVSVSVLIDDDRVTITLRPRAAGRSRKTA